MGADRPRDVLPIELLNSFDLLANARVEYVDAIVDYNRAQFAMYVALGQPPANSLAHPVPVEGVAPRNIPPRIMPERGGGRTRIRPRPERPIPPPRDGATFVGAATMSSGRSFVERKDRSMSSPNRHPRASPGHCEPAQVLAARLAASALVFGMRDRLGIDRGPDRIPGVTGAAE